MERTYQAINKNEVRAIQISINDQTGSDFVPSAAFAKVIDESEDTVVEEQSAMVSGSNVYTVIGTTVTATIGEYTIIWRIVYGQYTYYHATTLEVTDW